MRVQRGAAVRGLSGRLDVVEQRKIASQPLSDYPSQPLSDHPMIIDHEQPNRVVNLWPTYRMMTPSPCDAADDTADDRRLDSPYRTASRVAR